MFFKTKDKDKYKWFNLINLDKPNPKYLAPISPILFSINNSQEKYFYLFTKILTNIKQKYIQNLYSNDLI